MKSIIAAAAGLTLAACSSVATPSPVTGQYMEARTVNVFVGACHYGAECATNGREAVLAWHVDRGSEAGVSLAGLDFAAVVAAEENLAEGGARRSVVMVSDRAGAAERDAAVAWLRRTQGERLGSIAEVRSVALSVVRDGDHIEVRAPRVELRGDLLKSRDCCTMPHMVWYKPVADIEKPIVGSATRFTCAEPLLEREWTVVDENCVMAAAF